jgi:hypothetical protein
VGGLPNPPISYTLNFGPFIVTPTGCAIDFSHVVINNGNSDETSTFPSVITKFADSVKVIVGPSTDTNLVNKSPFILTVTAFPKLNNVAIKTDTLKIVVINTPVDCATVTVTSTSP